MASRCASVGCCAPAALAIMLTAAASQVLRTARRVNVLIILIYPFWFGPECLPCSNNFFQKAQYQVHGGYPLRFRVPPHQDCCYSIVAASFASANRGKASSRGDHSHARRLTAAVGAQRLLAFAFPSGECRSSCCPPA